MGAHLSSLGKPRFSAKLFSSADEILEQTFNKQISNFEEFHISFLEFCIKLNSILPGRHLDAPSSPLIQKCYKEWIDPTTDVVEKKRLLIELLERHVSTSKRINDDILTTALVAPTAAIIIKRVVPDVIFVPSFTILAIAALKALQIQKITKIL